MYRLEVASPPRGERLLVMMRECWMMMKARLSVQVGCVCSRTAAVVGLEWLVSKTRHRVIVTHTNKKPLGCSFLVVRSGRQCA